MSNHHLGHKSASHHLSLLSRNLLRKDPPMLETAMPFQWCLPNTAHHAPIAQAPASGRQNAARTQMADLHPTTSDSLSCTSHGCSCSSIMSTKSISTYLHFCAGESVIRSDSADDRFCWHVKIKTSEQTLQYIKTICSVHTTSAGVDRSDNYGIRHL